MYTDYPLKPFGEYKKKIRTTEIENEDVGQAIENMITTFLPKEVNHESI